MNNGLLRTLFCFYSPRGLFKQTLYTKLCGNAQTFCAFHIARITLRFRTVHHFFFVKAVTPATISLHTEKKNSILVIPFAERESRVKKTTI